MSRVHRPRMTLAAVGVAVLLIGCRSDEDTGTASTSKDPTTTATQTAAADAASRLEGTWQTCPISPREVDAPLRRDASRRGSSASAPPRRSSLPPPLAAR